MEELERHLRQLCANDSGLRLLEAQWEYDKHLVQQALQTVGTTFPHYSLHDASHSNTILINIARVLDKRVDRLSATDTWLLLEAAYWHDVGMVVSDADLRAWWSDDELKAHLRKLIDSDDGLLAASARLVSERTGLDALGDDWPLDVRQALTFVAADFARVRHPKRSAEAVRHPAGFSISSPRTLIPARLFEWLARICLSHGQSRAEVDKLPHCENGIGRDRCHPRFIAFMLRLGDLLDLDNGRFCPVLISSIGRIPPTSVDHIGKDASIERFFVGPDRIDVTATCHGDEDAEGQLDPRAYRSYHAISSWLEWLKDELTHLAIRWGAIAPADIEGAPSIGEIQARLEGYELLPGSTTPDFDIDSDYFLHLSKSSSLFGSPWQAWLRELITNAVDATLIRIWLTRTESERDEIESSDDPLARVYELSEQFPIEVSFTPSEETFGEPAMRRWAVTIADHGCGIGLEDLHSLKVIGSSSRNKSRQRLISKLPEYLRPTGSFGLGFQSVFLDTEKVTVHTRHLQTRETRRVVLARPSHKERPGLESTDLRSGVYVRLLDPTGDLGQDPGTTLSFEVTRPASYGLSRSGDPVVEDTKLADGEAWRRELSQICSSLPVQVIVNGVSIDREDRHTGFAWFDRERAIRIVFPAHRPGLEMHEVTHAYRGVQVRSGKSNQDMLPIIADLYHGKGSDMLQVNRSAFTATGSNEFNDRFENALPLALDEYLRYLREREPDNLDTIRRASLLAHAKYGSASAGDEWKALELPYRIEQGSKRVPVSLGDLLSQDEIRFLAVSGMTYRAASAVSVGDGVYMLPGLGQGLVEELMRKAFKQICLLAVVGPFHEESAFRSTTYLNLLAARKTPVEHERVPLEAFRSQLLVTVFPVRHELACPAKYCDLDLGKGEKRFESFVYAPVLLSPFYVAESDFLKDTARLTMPHLREYVEHVAKSQKKDPDDVAARAKIARATQQLLRDADEVYQKHQQLHCDYDLEASCSLLDSLIAQWESAGS